jgi:mannose-6-phosphate isomerase-like protein (cupin superfamily)
VRNMGEVRYYKGVHKVKVLTESEGYWIVEALEEFEDDVDGEKVTVKVGEQRIVPSNTVHKRKYLAPPIKEHAYELQMEKKLKKLVDEEEKKQD